MRGDIKEMRDTAANYTYDSVARFQSAISREPPLDAEWRDLPWYNEPAKPNEWNASRRFANANESRRAVSLESLGTQD